MMLLRPDECGSSEKPHAGIAHDHRRAENMLNFGFAGVQHFECVSNECDSCLLWPPSPPRESFCRPPSPGQQRDSRNV